MKRKVLRLLSYILVAALASAVTMGLMFWLGGDSKLEELAVIIDFYHIEDPDRKELEDAAAEAMVSAAGDRWSYYIPAEEYEAYLEDTKNAYVGIGVTIQETEDASGIRIIQVFDKGPAKEAGLLVEDVIIAVDGTSIIGMTTTEAKELVRGKKDTPVDITVRRDNQELTITVIRGEVEEEVAVAQLLEGNVGLITIYDFESRCAEETIAMVEKLLEEGAEKLVFDVRYNPGGYAHEMVKILDYLLPEGDLFRTVDHLGVEGVETSDENYLDVPMAVLVNGDTYSAAEFFAVALQEYGAAVVVGEKTTGKGYFQQTFRLSDGSAVALSTGKYFTPNGVSLEGVGITPDVLIELEEADDAALYYGQLLPEYDTQLQAALEVLK